MRTSNLISGVVLLVFGLLLLFWLIPWQVEEAFGGEVSPRLLPQICAIGICILSVILIVSNLRADKDPTNAKPPITWFEARAALIIAALLAIGIYVFTIAGPIPSSILLIVGVMFAMGERRILPYILIPAALLVGSYVLFYQILGTAII
jgi:hypothetical protein